MSVPLEMRVRALKLNDDINVTDRPAEEWLQFAIEDDFTARRCGPLDPAFFRLIKSRDSYLKAAVLREEIDQLNKKATKVYC